MSVASIVDNHMHGTDSIYFSIFEEEERLVWDYLKAPPLTTNKCPPSPQNLAEHDSEKTFQLL
eukprot:6467641-Amphidinium_carterae.1